MLIIYKTCLLPVLGHKNPLGTIALSAWTCMGRDPTERVLHVFFSSAWQVRAAFWQNWETRPLLQHPNAMAKAPKGSRRNAMKAAKAVPALCLRKVHTQGPRPAVILPHWGGTCHLSHAPAVVEEDEMGRPDWVSSSYFRGRSLCNTAQAPQLLPAACLSLRWQAFWSWVSGTTTNLGC